MNAPHLRVVRDDLPRALTAFDGHPPPHDIDAEAGVFAAIFVDAASTLPRVPFLQPEHFYSNAHMRAFEAVRALEARGDAIDTITVGSWLKDAGRLNEVGGMAYLTDLLNAPFLPRNVASYAATIFDLWRVRSILASAVEIQARGYLRRWDSVQSYADSAARALTEVARREVGKVRETNKDVLRRIFQQIQAKAAESGSFVSGLATGFRDIDERIGGLHRGHKITIAALPGRGKTTVGLQIARNVAERGIGVLYFSAEQTHEELIFKLLSAAASVPFLTIKSGKLSPKGWTDVTNDSMRIAQLPLWFETSPSMHVDEIRASAIRQVTERANDDAPLGLLVVDHLHRLVPPPSRDPKLGKNQHVDADTKALKKLAQELDLPLIELAQQKNIKDERPGDDCVAWSFEVQREADDLLYLHCTDKTKPYRNFTTIIHKCRFGEPGDVSMTMQGEFSRFTGGGLEVYE